MNRGSAYTILFGQNCRLDIKGLPRMSVLHYGRVGLELQVSLECIRHGTLKVDEGRWRNYSSFRHRRGTLILSMQRPSTENKRKA